MHVYIHIYIYIFTKPLAQGVLDHRYNSSCAIHKLWLSCGLVTLVWWVSEPFRAIKRGSWGSMLAYVGSCWGHVGLRWPQVGSKMAQDRFMLHQVGPRMPKKAKALKGLPSTPRWDQNCSKMASKSICFGFKVFFSKFASWPRFSTFFFLFRELGKHQFSPILGTKADGFSIILGILGCVCPKKPQDCCRMAYWSLSGTNIDPSWLQVGSSWACVGPNLVPTWLKLGPCWPQTDHPWANPNPSRW